MTAPGGPLPAGADLFELSLPLTQLASPSVVVANWLHTLSATQVELPTTCAARLYLAELLVSLLEIEGWCLSDMASGHVLAFAISDLERFSIKAD